MTKLKLLHDAGGGALRAVRVVMISVDGERDTPAVMKKYLAPFSPDFIGLTGNPRTVADIAARFSAVAFKEQPDPKGNYDYFHSSQVFLVDKVGRLRASFSDASLENMVTVTRLSLGDEGGEAGVVEIGGTTRRAAVIRDGRRLAVSAASRVVPIRFRRSLNHTGTRVTTLCRHNA
jgi:hypothetical protein